jgi:hypothetical protein
MKDDISAPTGLQVPGIGDAQTRTGAARAAQANRPGGGRRLEPSRRLPFDGQQTRIGFDNEDIQARTPDGPFESSRRKGDSCAMAGCLTRLAE